VDETGVRLVRGPLHWVVRDLNEGRDVRSSETGTGSDALALFQGVLVGEEVLHGGGPRHSLEPGSSSPTRSGGGGGKDVQGPQAPREWTGTSLGTPGGVSG